MHPRVQVSCLAIREQKIALIQKTGLNDVTTRNCLVPPGGHVELHETLEEACIRELFEETGLEVTHLDLRGVVTYMHHTDERHAVCFYFVTHDVSGALSVKERGIHPFWIHLDDVPGNDLIPEYHQAFIEHLLHQDEFLNARVEWQTPDHRVHWSIVDKQKT